MQEIITEYSPFYILLCLALAGGYAYTLYSPAPLWSVRTNRLLAGLRFVLVFLIALLLLGLFTRQIENDAERPILALAIDNSQSMTFGASKEALQATKNQMQALVKQAEEMGLEVPIFTLNATTTADSLTGLPFQDPATDLSQLIKRINNAYENRNLAGVIMLSDGIYNEGTSPSYAPLSVPVHTVALGDTIPKKDIALRALYANRVAYLGNKFPVVAEVRQYGFEGKRVKVQLQYKNKILAEQEITFDALESIVRVEFLALAEEAGIQQYLVNVVPLTGEFTSQNNSKRVFMEVLDNQRKVLIVANAPHPDIKALKSAIEMQESYQVEIYIPRLAPNISGGNKPIDPKGQYSLYIFHQVPNFDRMGHDVLKTALERKSPVLMITGMLSDLPALTAQVPVLRFSRMGGQRDQVTPAFNQQFDKFLVERAQQSMIAKYPPVSVPFGDYGLMGNAQALLFQRVGSVNTDKPMLAVAENDGQKMAVMAGEGIWQWRMAEYSIGQSHESFDMIFGKLLQYLATQEDKRKFRVYPTETEIFNSNQVQFATECYNDIYEPIYGQQIALTIKSDDGTGKSFQYVNTGPGVLYTVGDLSQGVYRYKAVSTMNGQEVSAEGQFVVKEQALEALNTTADFTLLRQLAEQSGGTFWLASQLPEATKQLLANRPPDILHAQETLTDLLRLPQILALLLLLATAEWGIRKFKGGY